MTINIGDQIIYEYDVEAQGKVLAAEGGHYLVERDSGIQEWIPGHYVKQVANN